MLTRLARPIPLEPRGIDQVGGSLAPGAHLPRPCLRPRGIQELDPSPWRRCGTSQSLGGGLDPAGNLRPPVGEVIGHFKGNGDKLDPTSSSFTHQCRNSGHEASCLAGKDQLNGFALALVSTLINENAEGDISLPRPEVAIKLQNSDDTEIIKPDVTVCPLPHVVGHDTVAVIIGWGLCELARTWDITAANIEPIPLHPPLRNVRHGCPPSCYEHFFSTTQPTS